MFNTIFNLLTVREEGKRSEIYIQRCSWKIEIYYDMKPINLGTGVSEALTSAEEYFWLHIFSFINFACRRRIIALSFKK